MQIDIIETTSLGDRSYLVSATAVPRVVIDPQRDIDRVLSSRPRVGACDHRGSRDPPAQRLRHGGLELSRHRGGDYVVPAGDDVALRAHPRRTTARCSRPARCGCG